MIDEIIKFGSMAIDKVGDIVNGVKEATDSVLHPIDTLLGNWGTDLLEGALNFANKVTFIVPNIPVVSSITNVFTVTTTTFASAIVLYKIIEAQIQAANGSGEALAAKVIQRTLYSALGLAILPWSLKFFITKIVTPLGEYVIQDVVKTIDIDTLGSKLTKTIISGFFTGGQMPAVILFILFAFFAYSIAKYFVSICVFYADFLVLTMLTPFVALSLLTDEQNYFSIWIKELLSQTLTMLMKLVLYSILLYLLLGEKITISHFMVMVGCALLLIKTPSALQNMWYSTKVRQGGGMGMMHMAMNLFRK
ncbi:conjugal transfer protein TrbL family protein [Enterococcus hirae]